MGNGLTVHSTINVVTHVTHNYKNEKSRSFNGFQNIVTKNLDDIPEKLKVVGKYTNIALIICNSYENTPHALGECATNDACLANSSLNMLGYQRVVVHDLCKSDIINLLDLFLSQNAEKILVYYIGHGTITYTSKSKYEKSGMDQAFVAMDGIITDNMLNTIVKRHAKPNKKIILISDCCHSGSIYDLTHEDYMQKNIFSIGACGDNETAKQDYICRRGNGIFSYYFWKYYNKNIKMSELINKVNAKLIVYRQQCITNVNNTQLERMNDNI